MTFQELLRAHPHLHQVSFYYLKCNAHGTFRMLANGLIPDPLPEVRAANESGTPAQHELRHTPTCAASAALEIGQCGCEPEYPASMVPAGRD